MELWAVLYVEPLSLAHWHKSRAEAVKWAGYTGGVVVGPLPAEHVPETPAR